MQCTKFCTLYFQHLMQGTKFCTLQFITYPDDVYKVATAAIFIQTKGVQSMFSLKIFLCTVVKNVSIKFKTFIWLLPIQVENTRTQRNFHWFTKIYQNKTFFHQWIVWSHKGIVWKFHWVMTINGWDITFWKFEVRHSFING